MMARRLATLALCSTKSTYAHWLINPESTSNNNRYYLIVQAGNNGEQQSLTLFDRTLRQPINLGD